MGKINDITIDVKANLNVSRRTAEICLNLVEIFCNDKGLNIICHRDEDGNKTFEFEKPNRHNISQEALDALNAIGRDTHTENF